MKDVSGDTFEDNKCDYNCDISEKPAAASSKKPVNKISAAEIVTEAIQRIDPAATATGLKSSSSRMENRVDSNKKLLVQQQRQRHSSTKKNRKKSGYQPILPAPATSSSDIDLYLNSNSNVSPDSGIQSEPGLTNSSPPQIIPAGNSGSTSSGNETVLQFSPGSTTTVYTQWPPNGYFSGISTTGQDCYSTGTNPGYILSNSGTTLMAVVTPVHQTAQPTNAQAQTNPVSDPDLPPTILPATPAIMLENPDIFNPIKRGRGRPKGSKNKKKTVTCESGCQTIESSLESGSTGSKKSDSPISVFDDDEEPPPPVIFMESRDHPVMADRTPSKIRKDPPRLEPQVELRNTAGGSAGMSDSDTIMFSDGEDDPDPEPPVIRIPELLPPVKLKKKKKKKIRDEPESLPPTLSKPKKQKRKKRNKEYLRATPPLLEPIENPVKSPIDSEFRPISRSEFSSPTAKSPDDLFPKSPVREEPEFPASPPQISIPELPDNSETFEEVSVEVSPVVSPARSSLKPDSENCSENDEPPVLTVPDEPKEPTDEQPEKPPDDEPLKPFQFSELKPVFSAKYRTLKVDKFWKVKKRGSSKNANAKKESTSNHQPVLVQTIPPVVTKAAVKEIVNVPLKSSSTTPSTKTMLAVLKSTNLKSKPGRRKKKATEKPSSKSKEQQQCFSPKSVHSSTDESEPKSKKSINKSLIEMGWRTKHKNVIDPLFLGLLEQMIQDMSNVQMDKKLSKDLWPDRPNSSLPTIFKKRKFVETTKVSKRGRPKKTEAEQRLPLKKRHHHVDSSEGKDQKGRISRKTSTDDQKKAPKNSSNSSNSNSKNNTTGQLVTNQNGQNSVSTKNIVDSIAACVDKYTKKDFSQPLTVSIQENVGNPKTSTTPRKRHLLQMQDQNEPAPPTLEMEETAEKSRERPRSPPKLTKFDEINSKNPLTSPISEDEGRRPTPPNVYRPKVSDISDASDVDPISPKVIKIMKQNDVMHCSVKLKKLAEEKKVDEKAEVNQEPIATAEEKPNEEVER